MINHSIMISFCILVARHIHILEFSLCLLLDQLPVRLFKYLKFNDRCFESTGNTTINRYDSSITSVKERPWNWRYKNIG